MKATEAGFVVKETPTHLIVVCPMLFNWRVCTTPKCAPYSYDRFWCYAGRDAESFHRAVAAAMAWDGADDTEPEGWNKNGQTHQWREPRTKTAP